MNKPMKIAVIDTGYNHYESQHFLSVSGKTIHKKDDGICVIDGYNDLIGHGTIVCNLLDKYLATDVELYVIKIFDKEETTDVELLTAAIDYCSEKIKPEVVQISMGVLLHSSKLMKSVKNAAKNGVCIVAAFDNEKCLSYPAAYEEVIGVDVSHQYKDPTYYCLSEYDVVDVIGPDYYHRTRGLNEQDFIVHGSSFYCSYVTALVICTGGNRGDKKVIKALLKKKANSVIERSERPQLMEFIINKAVVFPFNKENHSLAAFEHMLPYEICGYYDIRQSGKINRSVENILGYSNNNKIIRNIDSLVWNEEFDTFICGHTEEMSDVLGYSVLENIAEKCALYGKQLFCFDDGLKLAEKHTNLKMMYPAVSKELVPQYRFGKMRTPGVPTVGVFGTSSKQGKMTIQLLLRQEFKRRNIKIKSIGTEPESSLLGFEFCYPFGYHSVNYQNSIQMIHTLNEAIFNLEKEECDIIVAGSQSGTVAHQLRNIEMIPTRAYDFLLGVQPDTIILCVNSYDDINYIKRTIKFVESAVDSKVIMICVSDIKEVHGLNHKEIGYFENELEVPAFSLKNNDVKRMVDIIVNYYGG